MEKEKDALLQCRAMIEQTLNWGHSDQWINQDFENLSERIFAKTQVRLSVSTLKRIWGKVKYDSSPTMATLNAFAQFLDYENWREFQSKNGSHEIKNQIEHVAEEKQEKKTYNKIIRITSVAAITIAGLALTFLLIKSTIKPVIEGEVKFESRKVADDLPNSVVFNYDVSKTNADSFFIQQSWDPKRRTRVSKEGKQHTSIYYMPGYFMAKLIVNNEIAKEDVVFIKTNGWKAIVSEEIRAHNLPFYLNNKEIHLATGLGVTREVLKEKTGKSIFNNYWVTFANVREFDGLNGQSFTLETHLKNTSTVEESLCRKVEITLLSKGGAIMIPLAAKGCIADIGVGTGERWVAGQENDLSAFGCDFTDFEKVKCKVENKTFQLYLNDKLIFEEKQQSALDDIIGIRISFEGTGEIKEIKLSDNKKVVYEEVF